MDWPASEPIITARLSLGPLSVEHAPAMIEVLADPSLYDYIGSGYCGMNALYVDIAVGGDSGGPYFNDGIARGTHSGYATINGMTRDIYTRIGALNLLNAVVVVN
jgi:hypothetical protein